MANCDRTAVPVSQSVYLRPLDGVKYGDVKIMIFLYSNGGLEILNGPIF